MTNSIEILLVEDTPSDVRLTEEALKRSGITFKLTVVNDGVAAMEHLKDLKSSGRRNLLPDMILLDLNMPRKNGHEVLEEIKADSSLRHIPVVLLTVSEREEDIMEALRSKMNYYLAKPVTAAKLSSLIKAIDDLHNERLDESYSHSNDEDNHVRLVLAGNPHTAAIALTRLAQDVSEKVRRRVAENVNTPIDVLMRMSKDPSIEVRIGVCENANTPATLLEPLADDPSDEVRLELSGNSNIPKHLLKKLAKDENIYVSENAKKSLALATSED